MSQYGSYSLPPTAICPGCGAMVTLPAEPIYPDSPPAICATCDTEVPDYRREAYNPAAGLLVPDAPPAAAAGAALTLTIAPEGASAYQLCSSPCPFTWPLFVSPAKR